MKENMKLTFAPRALYCAFSRSICLVKSLGLSFCRFSTIPRPVRMTYSTSGLISDNVLYNFYVMERKIVLWIFSLYFELTYKTMF